MKCAFVSVWDDGIEIVTPAEFDPVTKRVTDIEFAPLSESQLSDLEISERQYISVAGKKYPVHEEVDGEFIAEDE